MSFLRRLFGQGDSAEHHHSDEPVPGWDAISAALEPLYGDEEPVHWGTIVRWRTGGPDPLDGISAYRAEGPPPHWHYVSYGLSELYEKESDDPTVSGWGMELTFRLQRSPSDESAPVWPAMLLQNLARYVFESGAVLSPGDHLDLNGPIALDETTAIKAIAFAEDEQLGTIETPYGTVTFVQIVGLTMDEYEAVQDWNTAAFLDILRGSAPLLVTDLARGSILADERTAALVLEGIARDGSSMAQLNSDELDWSMTDDRVTVVIGATNVSRLLKMLRGRLTFDKPLRLQGASKGVWLTADNEFAAHEAGDGELHVDLAQREMDVILDTLRPIAGSYPITPRFSIEVERSIIRDQSGRQVEVIG